MHSAPPHFAWRSRLRNIRGFLLPASAVGFLLWLAALWLALPTHANLPPQLPITGERIALVFGNAAYTSAPRLSNPGNDAKGIANLLTRAGFKVDLQLDAGISDMRKAIERFEEQAREPQVKTAVFFYAGHAVQLDWHNFLISTDANIHQVQDLHDYSINLSKMLQSFDNSHKAMVLVLDSCRDNPFRETLQIEQKGMSQLDAPANTLVAFSTAPGQVAFDGEGKNSFYTATLLRELGLPYMSLEDSLKRVRTGVRVASLGRQIPWESTSLENSVYLYPPPSSSMVDDATLEANIREELGAWSQAKNDKGIGTLVTFLQKYPNGNFSQLAQFRLDRLLREQVQQEAEAIARRQRILEEERQRQQIALVTMRNSPTRIDVAPAPDTESAPQNEAVQGERIAQASEPEPAERIQTSADSPTSVPAPQAEPITPIPEPKPDIQTATARPAEVATKTPPVEPTQSELSLLEVAKQIEILPPLPVTVLAQYPPVADIRVNSTPEFKGATPLGRTFRVGDQWSFKTINKLTNQQSTFDLEVTQVDASADKVTYNHGKFFTDLMGNATNTDRGMLDSPRQFYPATLQLGNRWITSFKQSRTDGKTAYFRYDVKIVAKEKMTVGAGTFTTYRIEASGKNTADGTQIKRTLWVAPGINANIALEVEVRDQGGHNITQNYRWELQHYQAEHQPPEKAA